MKYGYCINHLAMYAINAKKLCGDCTKERHKKSAESKGLTVKEKKDGNVREWERRNELDSKRGLETQRKGRDFKSTRRRDVGISRVQSNETSNNAEVWTNKKETKNAFKKAHIKPRSEKNKEIIRQELLMFKEIWDEREKQCEHCNVELHVWHPILFHHIRSKGAHCELRLVKENIALICAECHIKEHGFKPRK